MKFKDTYKLKIFHKRSGYLHSETTIKIRYGYYSKHHHLIYYGYCNNLIGEKNPMRVKPVDGVTELDINNKRAAGFVRYTETKHYNYAGEVVSEESENGYYQKSQLRQIINRTETEDFTIQVS